MAEHISLFGRAGMALAATLGAAASLHAVAASQLPPEHTRGALSYVSGGVTVDEAREFRAAFNQFPLVIQLLERAGRRDEFTADARVRITDRHGQTLLDERADGPYMLVRLPAGDYTLHASLAGTQLPEHRVHVSDHGHVRSVFEFPARTG